MSASTVLVISVIGERGAGLRVFDTCSICRGGSLHIERARVETRAVFALHESGFPTDRIAAMYPQIAVDGLGEAIDLEVQLQRNIAEAA